MITSEVVIELTLLWAVVDPVGTVPVYLAVTAGLSHPQQRQVAWRAVGIAAAVLFFFAVAGEALLKTMVIPLASFQVAGGIVLFVFALTMIFGPSKPDEEIAQIDRSSDYAVFPLAIPSIASPGAILAVIMMTDSHSTSFAEQLVSMALLATVLLVTLVLLLIAQPIQKIIGRTGASVVSRTMGLILAAIAVDNVMAGLLAYFETAIGTSP